MKNTQISALEPIAILDEQSIQDKIYTLRGMQVMLDRDLAELYAVKAIRLREQIRRNIKRFPDDFMFQLNESEVDLMVSQNAIPSKQHLGGAFPLAFTEQGIANISGILTNDIAIDINLRIMRTFVKMRHFIAQNVDIFKRLDFIIGASLKDLVKKWFGFSKMDSQSFEMMGRLK